MAAAAAPSWTKHFASQSSLELQTKLKQRRHPNFMFTAIQQSVYLSVSVLNVKRLVGTFNQEKALVGAFSVITNLCIAFVSSSTLCPGPPPFRLCPAPVRPGGRTPRTRRGRWGATGQGRAPGCSAPAPWRSQHTPGVTGVQECIQ